MNERLNVRARTKHRWNCAGPWITVVSLRQSKAQQPKEENDKLDKIKIRNLNALQGTIKKEERPHKMGGHICKSPDRELVSII